MSAKQPVQAFKSRSTHQVTNIRTLVDPKTGERIVLWSDIKSAFEDAKTIRSGDYLVSFLVDENSLELFTPWRIAYYPDDILEVVTESDGQVGHARETSTSTSIRTLPVGGGEKNHDASYYQLSGTNNTNTLSTSAEALQIAETSSLDQPLVRYSVGMSEDSRSSLLAYSRLYDRFLQTIQSGQETQATGIKQYMDQHFDQLQHEMDKNKELQEQLVQMQRTMLQMQDQMQQMQQKALDRLAIIQSSVQALVTQTYELHEYPIPRLFIVLPKAVGFSGKLKSMFSDQLRLYFLCECGTHTMTEDAKTPHHIHLAKHDGYDLEKPSAFFERYGTYVLTLMRMIKFGITAAGLVVPPLATNKIVDGLETAQKHMEYLRKNIAPLVDDTINFLSDIKGNNGMSDEQATDGTGFEQLEALEGADLRELETYLKVKDQGRVLGNLFRIITSEGHVKWVCFDHYRTTYRETAIQQLRDVVEVNRGKYVEETGRIEIKLASNILAKQFYEVMVEGRGVQELEITLEWDASMDDLRTLANSVTKANVIRLTVDGTHLKGPALDVVNRGRRFDPILKLASNNRIQLFQLKGFEDFFARVSKSSLPPSPKLRVLSIQSEVLSQDKVKSLGSFLEYYSALTTLEVKLHQDVSLTKTTSDILNTLPTLESLRIDRGKLSVTASISKGKIQSAILAIDRIGDLNPDDLVITQKDEVKKLALRYHPWYEDEDQLPGIFHISDLSRIRIKYQGEESLVVAATPEWNLQEFKQMVASRASYELVSYSINCQRLTLTSNMSQGRTLDMIMAINRLCDLNSDDLTFIQQGHLTRLVINEFPRREDEDRLAQIFSHALALTHLRIRRKVQYSPPIATVPEMKLLDIVKMATSDTLCKLESLRIDSGKLSIIARVSQGKIQDSDVRTERLDNISSDVLTFMQENNLTRLTISDTPQKTDEDRLAQILRHLPVLMQLQIGHRKKRTADTTIEMDLQDIVKLATTDTICNLESTRIDFWGFSVGVSQGKIQDVAITVDRLDDFSPDNIKFVHEAKLTRLAIKFTPQEADEGQLADILHHCPYLSHLQIGCEGKRLLAVINVVISIRERIVQERGSSSLRTLELMEENLVPFDIHANTDDNSHIQSHLEFSEDSNSFDMRTWIRLKDWMSIGNQYPVNNFVRQYGWSIVFFNEECTSNNTFAAILDGISNTRTSQLERLWIRPMGAASELSRLDKIIERSPNFKDLGLYVYLNDDDQFKMAQALLGRHGKVLSKLRLTGDSSERRSWIASTFPTRNDLPTLASLEIWPTGDCKLRSDFLSWILVMLSSPPRELESPPTQPLSQNVVDERSTHDESKSIGTWTPLRKIMLRIVTPKPEEWKPLIEAIDFSSLEHLDLRDTNFSQEQFELLVDRIFGVRLGTLDIVKTDLVKMIDSRTLKVMFTELLKKAPSVNIIIDRQF